MKEKKEVRKARGGRIWAGKRYAGTVGRKMKGND